MKRAFAFALVLGCTRAPTTNTSTNGTDAAIVTVMPTDAAAGPVKESTDAALVDPRRWVALGASSVEIALLPEDQLVEDPPGRFSVHRSASVSVALIPATTAAPKSIPDVGSVYGSDAETHDLGRGTTPDGAIFALRSFRVRVGHSGVGGQIVHGFKRVARAEVVLPLDATHHVQCTGYVEHDVADPQELDFDWVTKICLSLRKKR